MWSMYCSSNHTTVWLCSCTEQDNRIILKTVHKINERWNLCICSERWWLIQQSSFSNLHRKCSNYNGQYSINEVSLHQHLNQNNNPREESCSLRGTCSYRRSGSSGRATCSSRGSCSCRRGGWVDECMRWGWARHDRCNVDKQPEISGRPR